MNGQKSIRIEWRSSGGKSHSHMKVNSTLWGTMAENGIGRGTGEPLSNHVVSKTVKHKRGSIMVWVA